jgi:hypothetical protein
VNLKHGELTPDRRERLAEKGRMLYRKACGIRGDKTCAEGFAVYHIQRQEPEVAQDLLAFLESEADALRQADPEARLATTEDIASRIRAHLGEP